MDTGRSYNKSDRGEFQEQLDSKISAEQIIAKLPEEEHKILELHFLENSTNEDIQKITGLSIDRIRKVIFRAPEKLQKFLPRINRTETEPGFVGHPKLAEKLMEEYFGLATHPDKLLIFDKLCIFFKTKWSSQFTLTEQEVLKAMEKYDKDAVPTKLLEIFNNPKGYKSKPANWPESTEQRKNLVSELCSEILKKLEQEVNNIKRK